MRVEPARNSEPVCRRTGISASASSGAVGIVGQRHGQRTGRPGGRLRGAGEGRGARCRHRDHDVRWAGAQTAIDGPAPAAGIVLRTLERAHQRVARRRPADRPAARSASRRSGRARPRPGPRAARKHRPRHRSAARCRRAGPPPPEPPAPAPAGRCGPRRRRSADCRAWPRAIPRSASDRRRGSAASLPSVSMPPPVAGRSRHTTQIPICNRKILMPCDAALI